MNYSKVYQCQCGQTYWHRIDAEKCCQPREMWLCEHCQKLYPLDKESTAAKCCAKKKGKNVSKDQN